MKLPDGVFYRPLQEHLIAKGKPAIIRVETGGSYSGNDGYRINERPFELAIAPYLHGDWEDFDRLFRLNPRRVIRIGRELRESPILYSGAEHSGSPKKPNIAVIPNWGIAESRGLPSPYTVIGCTMGHFHPKDPSGSRTQEVYEFQSHGILALDRENGEPEIWVARDGDKVAIPDGCHMTLYNLGDENHPLIALDLAAPDRNPSDKELIKKCGPILLIYYDNFEVTFVLNRLYVNNPEHAAGVRPSFAPAGEERYIRIPRASRMDLGGFLYEQLTGNPEDIGKFERLGLRIKRASAQAALEPVAGGTGTRLYFSRPLAQAAVPGTEVYSFFIPTGEGNPNPSQTKRQGDEFVKALERKEKAVRQLIDLKPLNKPLVILVQGAGEWVEGSYRPAFESLVKEGYHLEVFYADDTSWKGAPPAWARELRLWEVYLDKSNPKDLARYRNVLSRVDDVFIATPDFTHSEIAKECVRKRVPTIFVEKPFDSHIENVDSLLKEMGFLPLIRAVVGVDHYMFYAFELKNLMPEIQRHLGGALNRVEFYMTESRPIERERERTLQHGLMLDMLPHMFAMLAYFGYVSTVDDIRIVESGQYEPLISQDKSCKQYNEISSWYKNETYARVRFTFEDYAGNRVPCLGVVGKGFSEEVKYMEVVGVNGNAVRIDLVVKNPSDYPYDTIFLLAHPERPSNDARMVADPYNHARFLYILPDPMAKLDRKRYKRLIEDLINGTANVISNVLLLDEAYEIVRALDRIWWAIQDARSWWSGHDLGKLNPVQPD